MKYQREEIACESRDVRDVYVRELSVPELGVSDKYEISVVTAGRGICRVLNEVMECKEGDMFVIGRGIPHGFFVTDGGSELNILSVLQAVVNAICRAWFNAGISIPARIAMIAITIKSSIRVKHSVCFLPPLVGV